MNVEYINAMQSETSSGRAFGAVNDVVVHLRRRPVDHEIAEIAHELHRRISMPPASDVTTTSSSSSNIDRQSRVVAGRDGRLARLRALATFGFVVFCFALHQPVYFPPHRMYANYYGW